MGPLYLVPAVLPFYLSLFMCMLLEQIWCHKNRGKKQLTVVVILSHVGKTKKIIQIWLLLYLKHKLFSAHQNIFFLIWWHLVAFIFMFLSFYEVIDQGVWSVAEFEYYITRVCFVCQPLLGFELGSSTPNSFEQQHNNVAL